MFPTPQGGKKSAIDRRGLVLAGGAICACASLAGGQEAAAESAFEVASVKLLTERRPAPARMEAKRISLPFTTLGYGQDPVKPEHDYCFSPAVSHLQFPTAFAPIRHAMLKPSGGRAPARPGIRRKPQTGHACPAKTAKIEHFQ